MTQWPAVKLLLTDIRPFNSYQQFIGQRTLKGKAVPMSPKCQLSDELLSNVKCTCGVNWSDDPMASCEIAPHRHSSFNSYQQFIVQRTLKEPWRPGTAPAI